MSRITKAHDFAKEAHGNQERKFTGVPYIVHLEETAQLLHEVTDGQANTEMYAAAVLHDVVEDTDVELIEIGREFGKEVMDLVGELTANQEEKERLGKKAYMASSINRMSKPAFLIKLCDRFSNVSGLENRIVPRNFVKWYVRETQYILDHLERELDDMEKYLVDKISQMVIYLRLDRNING
jgi:(p)ppGpp synthase/HD superfamily hydrolase